MKEAVVIIGVVLAVLLAVYVGLDQGRISSTSRSLETVARETQHLSEAVQKGLPTSRKVSTQKIPEELEAILFGLWSSVSPICPPTRPYAKLIVTDPFDPMIRKFNEASIATALLRGVEATNNIAIKDIGQEMTRALVMSGVQAMPAHFELSKLRSLDESSAAPVLTAAACFTLVQLDIRAETGLDDEDLYILRTSIDINISDSALSIRVNLPRYSVGSWAEKWALLFQNTFERPPVILVQDVPRERLWKWIDSNPKLIILDVDGNKVFEHRLVVPVKKDTKNR
ncbi:MAG: hypothetical protein EPN94_10335 [Nitrospirae bacterium]|nr:MAG: hypothetical protein EPN94_10335 [Nitrospirota bacterium]